MNTKNQPGIARLAGFGAVVQASNVLVLLATTVALSRQMGLEIFGEYVLLHTQVFLSTIVTSFGLPTVLTRELAGGLADKSADEHVDPWRIFCNSLTITALLFVCLVAIVVSIQAYFPPVIMVKMGLAAFVVVLGRSLLEICAGTLAGLGQIRKSQLASSLLLNAPFLVLLIGVFSFTSQPLAVNFAFQLQAVGVWGGTLLAFFWVWRCWPEYKAQSRARSKERRQLMRSSIPLFKVNALTALQQNIVFFVLGAYLSTADVGVFRIAERIAGLSQFLRVSLTNILQPSISRHWREGTLQSFVPVVRKWCALNVMFNFALFAGVGLFGPVTITLIFGAEAVAATGPLLVLLLGHTVAASFGFNGMILSMTSNAGRMFQILLWTLGMGCTVLVVLTPIWGVIGASTATGVYTVLTALFLWRTTLSRTSINCAVWGCRTS